MSNSTEIFYKKNDNSKIFRYFENTETNKITNIQNYIPVYRRFFSLNKNNYNLINLNQKYTLKKIKLKNKENDNVFLVKVEDNKNVDKSIESFFKFSPLLDPTKYMAGKYKDISKNDGLILPDISGNSIYKRINCVDNASYIDGFFSYLSSKLLHEHGFVHGLDFYGSFLGIKEKFKYDITDDLEYLYDYDFFHNNKNVLFSTDKINEGMLDDDTRKNRKRIVVENNLDIDIEELDDKIYKGVFKELTKENLEKFNNQHLNDINLTTNNLDYVKDANDNNSVDKTNSECSSRVSDTSNDEDDESEDDEEEDDEEEDMKNNINDSDENSCLDDESIDSGEDEDEEDEGDESEEEDEISDISSEESNCDVYAEVYDFPCQIICLEKMDKTLDICTEEEEYELTNDEWKSCLFQIIMTLLTYEKVFDFTHNDLHTNNIMYHKTDKKYLNYCYNGRYYMVPTHGKIYKIIDFGRAIYKFNGKQFCSDSFYPKGDAAGQFNFHVFKNEKKREINPNNAFDLARLGCSLYDFFFDDENKEASNKLEKLVEEWVLDDNGKNILYKSNGEERYPDFKLYKMITRKCSKNTPDNQLDKDIFKKFISSKKKIGKKAKIINIDNTENDLII
jgi:hypothetical protein